MAMALEGIKVLDLSRLAPGPYCSMLLADFGADVTLVEAVPGVNAKLAGPAADPEAAKRAAAYNALGRGKRSIALNLKNEAAREVFYELVRGADVVLEGFRPGVVNRLGVDYETLSAINPRIVYCSLSGFGQTGPYSNLVGHDINYISIGGALGVIGRPGTAPAIPVNLLADFAGGGLMAAFAICAALLAREHTGRGQTVDIAMSDGVLSLMTERHDRLLLDRHAPPPRRGLPHRRPPLVRHLPVRRRPLVLHRQHRAPLLRRPLSVSSAPTSSSGSNTTRPPGPPCASASRPSSPRRPPTSGWRSCPNTTSAPPPSSSRRTSSPTPTTSPAT